MKLSLELIITNKKSNIRWISAIATALFFNALLIVGAKNAEADTQNMVSSNRANVIKRGQGGVVTHKVDLTALSKFRIKFFHGIGQPATPWTTLPKEENESVWDVKERNRISKLTSGKRYNIIVLPVQMQKFVCDRISRELSAQIIGDEISSSTGKSVMPVELTQRLLGEHVYRFSDRSIAILKRKYHVKTVISLFAKQVEMPSEHYVLGYFLNTTGKPGKSGTFPIGRFSETKTLETMVWHHADKMLLSLYPGAKPFSPVKYTKRTEVSLESSFRRSFTTSQNSYTDAVKLEILAALTSHIEFAERNGYLERALVDLRHVDPSTKHYHVLFARAMFYLYRRPLALKYLRNDHSPSANALRDMLNGNYPELKKDFITIKDPVFRLFSYIDVNDLAYLYGPGIDRNKKNIYSNLMFRKKGWSNLIEFRRRDRDEWYAPNTAKLLLGMSKIFPAISKNLIKLMEGNAILGDLQPNDTKSQFLFMTSYKNELFSHKDKFEKHIYGNSVTSYDLLRLYRSIGISNILKKIDRDIDIYDLPDDAITLSNRASSYFDGKLAYLKREVGIDYNELKTAQGGKYLKYLKDMYITNKFVNNLDASTDPISTYTGYSMEEYLMDYDKHFTRPPYVNNTPYIWGKDLPSGYYGIGYFGYPSALDYTYHSFSVLMAAFKDHGKCKMTNKVFSKKEMEKALTSRFDGNANKITFITNRYEKNGDIASVIKLLNKAISQKSDNWNVYLKLGKIYLHKGKIKQASVIFNSYPLFLHPNNSTRVGLSNAAYTAATLLYFAGAYKQASPLYKYSAKLDTGSAGSLNSAFRYFFLKKQYVLALNYARHAGVRYNIETRYRDYLTLLALLGYPKQAEDGFKVLAQRFDGGQVWLSLFVSQRLEKMPLIKIFDWVKKYEAGQNQNVLRDAKSYLLLQALTDRHLNKKEYHELYSVFKPVKRKIPAPTFYGLATSKSGKISGKSLGKPTFRVVTIPNKYGWFLNAYQLLKKGEYQKAYDSYARRGLDYNQDNRNYQIRNLFLSYMAYAAMKSDNLNKFNQYLKYYDKYQMVDAFDKNLTLSIIEAGKHEVDKSLHFLDLAFYAKPEVEQRVIFHWYELTQFCVWLADATHDDRYIAKALQWVKAYEVIQPQYGWDYAFEAKYSKVRKDRIRATAFAEYLDPQSSWLKSVQESIKTEAKKWWKVNDPYVLPHTKANQNKMKI